MLEIQGIKLAAINSGANKSVKYKNRDDLLLIELPQETVAVGVFSKSSLSAAPVNWCRDIAKHSKARALIVNAGNANSFTGKQGDETLLKVVKEVAKLLNCKEEEVFMSSTGVIGEQLNYQPIINSLPTLIENFSDSQEAWQSAAHAIMTTDLVVKSVSKTAKIADKMVKINGFAKGSGMIAPNMATMLGYFFTDANIEVTVLQKLLREINEETFNSITVDSDHSTNDTVLLFSTNQAGNPKITDIDDVRLVEFKAALKEAMLDLAKKIVADGEGATKLIKITVTNAASKKAAKNIALSIANSPLVKTAIAGCDPNWGRIVMAIGKSEEQVNQDRLDIKIGDVSIVKNGELDPQYVEAKAHQYLKGSDIEIEVNLNLPSDSNDVLNSSTIWTCDLTEGYIKINKDYRS